MYQVILIKQRNPYLSITLHAFLILHSKWNQQQINGSFNIKFQHLIDGQLKKLDIQHSMPSTVTQNIIAYISTFTINPDSSSDMQPHPKRQRQMLLTPSVSNRSRVPSQSDIQLDLKHVQQK